MKHQKSEPFEVIIPKNNDQITKTKEDVKGKLNSFELSIRNMRNLTKGVISFKCKNKEAMEEVKTRPRTKMKMEMEVSLKGKTWIKVVELSENRFEDEVTENIVNQNNNLRKMQDFIHFT